MDSLLSQEHDEGFNWELIVVDNNSKDKTMECVKSYKARFNGRLQYLFEQNQGLSYARNCGIKKAKGEIIVFSDDDCTLDKQWIKNIVECFRNHICDAVGGRVLPLYSENTPRWVKENKLLLNGPFPLHDYGEPSMAYAKGMLPFIGANMAFKRECFDRYGLFRTDLGPGQETMGDDTEFFRRLEKRQSKLLYCGQALAWHKVEKERTNFKYLAKWFMASGRYAILEDPDTSKISGVYYFGVPRYIFRQLGKQALDAAIKIFNQKAFLKAWVILFFNLGQISGYTRINKCLK